MYLHGLFGADRMGVRLELTDGGKCGCIGAIILPIPLATKFW